MSDTQKTALVTGANRGIGKEIVRQLAGLGYKVFLGARDQERGQKAVEELRGLGLKDVHFLEIDVNSDESVANAAKALGSKISALDVLINNAAVLLDGEIGALDVKMDMVKTTFEANVFGVVRTTQAFVSLLKKSKAGRIVNVGSCIGSQELRMDKSHFLYDMQRLSYSASKAAVNSITVSFSKALAEFNIKVNTADPGWTATDMTNNEGLHTVEVGAQSSIFLATLPDDGPTGSFFDKDGVLPW